MSKNVIPSSSARCDQPDAVVAAHLAPPVGAERPGAEADLRAPQVGLAERACPHAARQCCPRVLRRPPAMRHTSAVSMADVPAPPAFTGALAASRRRLALPACAADPDRGRPGADPRKRRCDLHHGGPRRGAAGGPDGQGHRGARGPLRSRDRWTAERDVRKLPGADHRLLRASGGSAGGRQGDHHRLDHRQHPAGARSGDAGRRLEPQGADVQHQGGRSPVGHALARDDGARDAGRLPARRRTATCRCPATSRSTLDRKWSSSASPWRSS